jgi:hypothetical protein
MTHQVHARLGPFLFFFEILLESYLLDTAVVLNDKGIVVSLVLRVLAERIVIA